MATPYPKQEFYPTAPPPAYEASPNYATNFSTNYGPGPQAPFVGFAPPMSTAGPGEAHPPYPMPPPPAAFVNMPTTAAAGAYKPEEGTDAQFGLSFSDKNIRRLFVRKVYAILMVQLLVTFGCVALFIFEENTKKFVRRNPGIYYGSYVTFLVLYFALVCCPDVRRKYPTNLIVLGLFTLALSFMTGTISSYYKTNVVIMCIGMCAAICFCITMLAMFTKFDLTGCQGILAICGLVLFFFGIVAIFTYSNILYTVYAALSALLFMGLLAVNTQMIMGGRRHEMSPEEYVFAALVLYLDIVYIFLFILSLAGGRGK